MPFSTLMLAASLEGLKWLFWAIAGLLVVMLAAQWLRGEEGRPLAVTLLAIGSLAVGFGCGALARRLGRDQGE
ncbi:MAG: hypothetical protein JNK46_16490 [Methylobacteriaceae bacterium]|nr:hypothetical protein [Methylobacteriaceae bacterium]